MNIGKNILEQRRKKNVTQEELAAELGVTAAAVSKWENGYTLPDIMMLCALADFFGVTTDELLGRNPKAVYAVVAASSPELGNAIRDLAKRHGFIVKSILGSYPEALKAVQEDPSVSHLFASFDEPLCEEELGNPSNVVKIEVHAQTTQQVLDGFELFFQNTGTFNTLAQKGRSK